MRFLFAIFVLFSLMWAASEVLTSVPQAEVTSGPFFYEDQAEEPADSLILLIAIIAVSYSIALTALGLMVAKFVLDLHARLGSR